MDQGPIEEYLRRKGALEIIVEIGTGSATFQDIEDAVLVSSSTVSTRLREGVETDLLEITHRPTDHGTQKRYTTSGLGERVVHRIREIDLDKTVEKLQRLQRDRDTELERLIGRLNRDKEIVSYEYSRRPSSVPEEVDFDQLSEYTEPSKSELQEAHQEKLEKELDEDIIGKNELDNDDTETNSE
ncbi:hypothetical protein [Halostagnicola bangensis]